MIDFPFIVQIAEKHGYTSLLPGVADAIGATFVISNQKRQAALKEDLGVRTSNSDWLKSGDCGISSKTIFAVLSGNHAALQGDCGDAPHDADDFGRCARLMERYPAWGPRLAEVAHFCPAFAPLVPVWGELSELYRSGKARELSLRIRELRSQET